MIFNKSYCLLKCAALTGIYLFLISTAGAQGTGSQSPAGKSEAQSQGAAGWQTTAQPENTTSKSENTSPAAGTKENKQDAAAKPDNKADSKQPNEKAAKPKAVKKPIVSNNVRIVSSTIDNSALIMANDLARLLDNGKKMRVVPIIGKGTAQSLKDLYYLKGVDLGIIQSDVLQTYKDNKKLPDPDKFIRYITTLGTQEVHVITRRNIGKLEDLNGGTVNIGPLEDGNAITANAVFEAHGISINSVHMDNKAAIHRLSTGAIDAVVIVSGKPVTNLLTAIAASQDFHLLDIGFNEKLKNSYSPTVMIHEDYPNLISKDRVVSSVSVDMILAMYYWPKGTSRYKKVERFVGAFFSRLAELQSPIYHSKWKEVRPHYELTGWKRFQAAQEWLEKNPKEHKKFSSLPGK